MESLPLEIIEKILSHIYPNVKDVPNFSSTCSYFHNTVLTSTAIWKNKYYDKLPKLFNLFSKDDGTYLEEIKYIYELQKRVVFILESMSPRFYKKYQLSDTDLEEWSQLINERKGAFYYIVDKLVEIINTTEEIKSIEVVPLNTPGNKTLQYYASKVLRYIKQCHLSKVWADYIHLPEKKQTLEKGVTLVAQWCQPELDITEDKIENDLSFISQLVRQKLSFINPNHQLFQASYDTLEKWKTENLEKSQWSIPECRQLITAMSEVIYQDLGFGVNTENFNMPQNFLINKVLETRKGLPITLAIIYSGVGRRLGLLFEPINAPTHFLLRFTEGTENNSEVYYIDTFHEGNLMQKTDCPQRPREVLFPVATPIQVVERIVNNLELLSRSHRGRVTHVRSILELLILVSPHDLSAVKSLTKLYAFHRINTKSLEEYLISQSFNVPPYHGGNVHMMLEGFSEPFNMQKVPEFFVKDRRSSNVKYAVGMIMIKNNKKCVICGWNCDMSRQEQLPMYNVLLEDGSYSWVVQEVLMPNFYFDAGNLLSHENSGRHFSHFFGNHFVPNAEEEKEYPCDGRIRHKHYYERQPRRQLTYYRSTVTKTFS